MHGEYGITDCCLSTLNLVGPNGIEAKLPLKLTDEEVAKLVDSANKMKEVISQINF
jgi:L-lactate dehydrogenase